MRYLFVAGLCTVSFNLYAACPAAPVGAAADPVVQLRLNGDGKAGYGSANALTSTEEGALVWDDSANALAYCDGTSWVSLSASAGADNLGNHTATQNLNMGGNDVTSIGTATASSFIATGGQGLLWENGISRITHNDGGGNAQIRFGHEFDGGEVYTQVGGAVDIESNIDATTNTVLNIKVSSNPGAGAGAAVAWGSTFQITPSDVTFGGTSLLPTAETDPKVGTLTASNYCTSDGSVVNCTTASLNANTLGGLGSGSFVRADANDNVSGHTEWQDGMQARFGNSADLRIWHDGTNNFIRTYLHGSPTYMGGEDAAGTNRNMIVYDPDNSLYMYYGGAEKLRTVSGGVQVTGKVTNVTNPTAAQDAATKAYVDSQAADANTLDGLNSTQFLRSDTDDVTSGNLGFTSGNGKGLRFWNSDSYKIYMSSVGDGTWGGRLDSNSDYNMYFRMNGGTNRGFVFRNGSTNVAQIDSGGNMYLTGNLDLKNNAMTNTDRIFLGNSEPSGLSTDGELAFDSSRGLILYRTQAVGDESAAGGYTVLDTSNIAAGTNIVITNTAPGINGTEAITIATDGNTDRVDGLHAGSFARSDANDTVNGHTEWQDTKEVRLGTDADFRMQYTGTTTVLRSYAHGAPINIQGENAGGTNRNLITMDPDNNVILYSAGAEKLRTVGAGVQVTGKITGLTDPTSGNHAATKSYVDNKTPSNADKVDGLHASSFIRSNADDNVAGHTEWQDNKQARFGNDADLRIWHDGTNHIIRGYKHGTPIYIQAENNGGTNRTMIFADPDAEVRLYHAGAEKLRTSSAGVQVNGRITGVSNPTGGNHAATKSYVDGKTLSCKQVDYNNSNGNGKFELPASGGTRFMVHNDPTSIGQRCKELGYQFGVGSRVFTHGQWCTYGNARTKAYRGYPSPSWVNIGCASNDSIGVATCCK